MKKIEFIGASGVGKSTLYNQLLLSYPSERWWKTPDEARICMAKGRSLKGLDRISRLLLIFLRLNLFPEYHALFALKILNTYIVSTMKKEIHKYNDLISLMLKSLIEEEGKEEYQKAEFIVFYMNLLKNNIFPFLLAIEETFIVYDDGILNNTSGFANEKLFNEMQQNNPALIKDILPQGVIFCELDLEDNIQRRIERIANGKGTCFERQSSPDKLREISKKSIEHSRKIIDIIEKYNIPVLRINMSDSSEKNIKRIHDFIDSCR